MDLMYLLLIAEFAFLVLMGVALWAVLRAMRRRSGGTSGGWAAAEAMWGVADPPRDPIARRENLLVGKVLWRNCVVVGVDPRGLHLAIAVPIFGAFGKKPVLIPWDAFHDPEPTRLMWAEAHRWHLGTPVVTTITMTRALEAKLGSRLGAKGREFDGRA
ncbi:MAG: hypothetical protein OEL76_11565 [Siculibacillus sp.]|nr:hypothetical protein [Siculibacillus sp.]